MFCTAVINVQYELAQTFSGMIAKEKKLDQMELKN